MRALCALADRTAAVRVGDDAVLLLANVAGCVALPENSAGCDSTCTGRGGVCPAGQVCAVAAVGGEGIDCGCFTPPSCLDAAVCGGGGNCPQGACVACPPSLCSTPQCVCSGD